LKTRRNRGTKLLSETEKWLLALESWSSQCDVRKFIRDIGFKIESDNKIKVNNFILSKHHAHFLKPLQEHFDFGYSTWAQFIKAVEQQDNFAAAMSYLSQRRQYDVDGDSSHKLAFPEPFKFGDVTVKFQVSTKLDLEE